MVLKNRGEYSNNNFWEYKSWVSKMFDALINWMLNNNKKIIKLSVMITDEKIKSIRRGRLKERERGSEIVWKLRVQYIF